MNGGKTGHTGYIRQQPSEGWNTNFSEGQLINNKNVNKKTGKYILQ